VLTVMPGNSTGTIRLVRLAACFMIFGAPVQTGKE
jgi:hypothetical protein